MQGDPEGALNNVLDRAIHGLPGWDSAAVSSQGQNSTRTRGAGTSEEGEAPDSMHREDLLSHQSLPTPPGAGDAEVSEEPGTR